MYLSREKQVFDVFSVFENDINQDVQCYCQLKSILALISFCMGQLNICLYNSYKLISWISCILSLIISGVLQGKSRETWSLGEIYKKQD